ncbi:hypothetical protein [Nonomuraea sp. JJY05]|uniref:hypothetical protein n=1 Tax=Nonomuraea sp. JJY05 TaxID=3350255 RepID=UPI00373E385C
MPAWVGDHFRIPTVGVTVDPHSHPRTTPRRRPSCEIAVGATAITAVASELGVSATVTAAGFYRTATTTP